jgi:predicted RNA methylase
MDRVFVDLGAGKGKVLLLAMEAGFKRVTGVELSPDLCRVALRNVERFKQKRQTHASVKVVQADVAHYEIWHDECIFFLYNPFGEEIMTYFLDNLERSIHTHARDVWLIYNNPVCKNAIEWRGLFNTVSSHSYGGTELTVYSTYNRNDARTLSRAEIKGNEASC